MQETHSVLLFLLGFNEVSVAVRSRAVASSSVAFGRLGFSQPRSRSMGFFRDVVYPLPMESNTSKLPHSTHGSGSERSLCAGPWPQPGDCWGPAGAQSLPFLQVGQLPLSSPQALHLSQLISSLHAAVAGRSIQCTPGFSDEGPQLTYPRAGNRV